MDVHFQCQHCRQHLVAETALGGREISCPKCGQPLNVPTVTGVPATEIRLTAPQRVPTPPAASPAHGHTLGERMPAAAPEPARVNDSRLVFTSVAVIGGLVVFIVALLNLERITGWVGGKRVSPHRAAAQADAAFLNQARDICAQYPTGGDIRAQTGSASVRLTLPAAVAEPLARSLAVTYARTRAAHQAGHAARVTILYDVGKEYTTRATDRSLPVDPPPPPPREVPPAPTPPPHREPPPPPLPRLVRETDSVPAAPEPVAPAAPVAGLLADSLTDFSDTQGQANWRYGYFPPPFTSAQFTEMPVFNAWAANAWAVASNAPPHAMLGRDTGRSAVRYWAARRWVSTTNAVVNITGSFVLVQGAPEWSVTARVLVEGRPVFARPLVGGDGVVCAVRATVREGATVDIVLENNSDTESPTANYRVQIQAVSAPAD